MKTVMLLVVAMTILMGCVSNGRAGHRNPRSPRQSQYQQPNIEVFVVNDRGHHFENYPIQSAAQVKKTYIQARERQAYSIEVVNHSNERVGVVVAVDGRNIISGKYSKLRSKERLYILNPHQRETFSGWRSGRNRVNRFYFTDPGNAYSASFGDFSAMGVIAVAAFREYQRLGYRSNERSKQRTYNSRRHSSPDSAGTGWGEPEYSPSHKVEFRAEHRPFSTNLIKYEWQQTLCEKRIINCDRNRSRDNRMWDEDDDYAPYPQRRFRRYDEGLQRR
jgi:hypothetical protein